MLTYIKYCLFVTKTDHSIGFQEKRHFCPKKVKIAENSDHTIDPWKLENHFCGISISRIPTSSFVSSVRPVHVPIKNFLRQNKSFSSQMSRKIFQPKISQENLFAFSIFSKKTNLTKSRKRIWDRCYDF
jgi:hypothetical protein